MGLLDHINGFFEEISTREGRERQLGIPANKRDRALRKRAVEEFKIKNPDFHIQGDKQDYDGYVQYISDGEKYCEFIEGERNCLRAFDSYIDEYGYDSVHRKLTARDLIPEIEDLFASHDQYFSKKVRDEKYLINIVLAQIWLDQLFKDPAQEKQHKKMIYEHFLEFIRNKEIPFYSIPEIQRSGPYAELFVVSKIMAQKNINLGSMGVELTPVDDQSFGSVRYGNDTDNYMMHHQVRFWCTFFERRQGIVVACDYLNIDRWC
jgi:hypothetical protein